MPISCKKLAAKKRLKTHICDPNSGQFVDKYSDSDELSDAYSTDTCSSDENFPEFKNISWTNIKGFNHFITLKVILKMII